ncbi:MAG: DUF4270 domain-containing protein [Bacteroidales bacterium]|nr:DUF4270 domain-containing protein [Bacteroidales bacterium]
MKKFNNPRLSRGFFRFSRISAVFIILAGLYISSCTKEFDSIGMDLIDDQLGLTTQTIYPVSAFTQIEDSVPSSLANLQLLGLYNDPVFGKTRASIYSEALPPTIPFNIPGTISPDSIVVDSVVLSLAYGGYFGNPTTYQLLSIFELEDTIPSGTIYSNKQLAYLPDPLFSKSFLPQPNDSVYIIGPEGDTTTILPPHARIHLPESFGRKFIDNSDVTSEFTSFEDYRGFFKGFHITVGDNNNVPGAIMYFNLRSTLSRLEIHYHYFRDEDTITTSYNFPMYDQFNRRFSRFENFGFTHASNEIKQQVLQGDTIAGLERTFIQSMSNFRTKIWLPELEELIDNASGQIAINSAKLYLPIDTELLQDDLGFSSRLILLRGNEEGDLVNLSDFDFGLVYFGGELDEDKKEYSFNITRHFQKVLSGELPNYPLYLRASNSFENAARAVLRGPAREENPMRIEINYTQPVNN